MKKSEERYLLPIYLYGFMLLKSHRSLYKVEN